jgi:VWFA-related protein
MYNQSPGRGLPAITRFAFVLCAVLAMTLLQVSKVALAQQETRARDVGPASATATADKETPRSSLQETPTFATRVNLVIVPVVIRDKDGKAVGSLKREDFQIFDDGKQEPISTFNMETNNPAGTGALPGSALGGVPIEKALGVAAPAHFIAYLFDDVHLQVGDLVQVRAAARKHLETAMEAGDRAALFTTSGDVTLEFTNDKTQLAEAMDRIKPGFNIGGAHCPYMNYYLAKKILEESGRSISSPMAVGNASPTPAWDGATDDTWTCLYSRADRLHDRAQQAALDAARREVQADENETRRALLKVEIAVRRLAAMPGTRTLILISPGFQIGVDHVEQNSAINMATNKNIIIDALDARGLYTAGSSADNGAGPSTPFAAQLEDSINREGLFAQTGVMAELTDGTGGKFFRDSNDLVGGFKQLATPPEYLYVLAFKPENLKRGGRYHNLKVSVPKHHGWTVQARRGYYESVGAGDSKQLVTGELQEALFSREEMHNLPMAITTESLKKDDSHRELSVTTHVDVSQIDFHRVNDRNVDDLTLVCGLFDLNGNYLQGKKQEISLHLADKVLQKLTAGMNVKTSFDVGPGAYLIRTVLLDSGDQLLSAVNGSSVIP